MRTVRNQFKYHHNSYLTHLNVLSMRVENKWGKISDKCRAPEDWTLIWMAFKGH